MVRSKIEIIVIAVVRIGIVSGRSFGVCCIKKALDVCNAYSAKVDDM